MKLMSLALLLKILSQDKVTTILNKFDSSVSDYYYCRYLKRTYNDNFEKSVELESDNPIDEATLDKYDAVDINVYQANMFHTKMLIKEIELQNYLFNTDVRELSPRSRLDITNALRREMIEIFSGRNVFGNGTISG